MTILGCVLMAAMLAHPLAAEEAPERVGLCSGGLLGGEQGSGHFLGGVDVQSANIYDYTFSSAPTDWVPQGGTWEQTSRWTCSPQWSWFGGFERYGVAALWNKRLFAGDISLELYAAFKMGVAGGQGREEGRDLNITLHGDGLNLDSGYSFILGGYGNTLTCIMRGTRILAATDEPGALLPSMSGGEGPNRNLHNEWEGVRACLRGNHLSLYHNEELVLEADDSAEPPLDCARGGSPPAAGAPEPAEGPNLVGGRFLAPLGMTAACTVPCTESAPWSKLR